MDWKSLITCALTLDYDFKFKSNNPASYFLTVLHIQGTAVYGGFGSAACLSHDQEGRKNINTEHGLEQMKALGLTVSALR